MKCPSCNKFATYDTGSEPEVNMDSEIEYTDPESKNTVTVSVTGEVRIVLTAECCGDELKESSFDVDESIEVQRGAKCECDLLTQLSVDEGSFELTERQESQSTRTKKDGTVVTRPIPFRFRKSFYGYSGQVDIKCECGETVDTIDLGDEVQASGMDELT